MILIKNARVMDPESGFDQVTDILLDGKKIAKIGKADDESAKDVSGNDTSSDQHAGKNRCKDICKCDSKIRNLYSCITLIDDKCKKTQQDACHNIRKYQTLYHIEALFSNIHSKYSFFYLMYVSYFESMPFCDKLTLKIRKELSHD